MTTPFCTCSTRAGTRPGDRHEPACGVWDWDGTFKRKDRDAESFVWLVIHDCLASAGIDYERAATAADILCDPVSGLTISVDGEGPRCRVRSCRDYGDPDFGEATCPSWHADEPSSTAVDMRSPERLTTVRGASAARQVASVTAIDRRRCDCNDMEWCMDCAPVTATEWTWRVGGTEQASGNLARAFEQSGAVEAESAGEAVEWLAAHGPVWDTLDQRCPVSIFLSPIETE